MRIVWFLVLAGICGPVGSSALAEELYFPSQGGNWKTVAPQDAGYDEKKLNAALDFAKKQNSSSLIVLYGGRILAERHWPTDQLSARYRRLVAGTTADGHVIEDVASVQKSVISFLVGVARGEGKLELDRPVAAYLQPGWSHATPEQERRITVRHLLSMTSGLNDALKFQADAGTQWRYNTGAYSKLVGVLEAALAAPIAEITRTRLAEPLDMQDTHWVKRPWAARLEAANKVGLATSARDLARFGLLIEAGGNWHGRDLLRSPGYLQMALNPSQKLNKSYGFLWWLNGQSGFRRAVGNGAETGSLVPSAPDDMVAARGALGRKLYIVPSRKLVVVRLGDDPGRTFDREFWQLLSAATNAPSD